MESGITPSSRSRRPPTRYTPLPPKTENKMSSTSRPHRPSPIFTGRLIAPPPRVSTPSAPGHMTIPDSDGEDVSSLSELDMDDEELPQSPEHVNAEVQGAQDQGESPKLEQTTPAPQPTVIREDKSEDVVCVCPKEVTWTVGRVGQCPKCSRLVHTGCRARNATSISGWLCYNCKDAVLEILPRSGYKAKTSKSEKHKPGEIVCVCPSQYMNPRTRLVKCQTCDVVIHASCSANRADDGKPGFRPHDDCGGKLVDEPDHIGTKRSSKTTGHAGKKSSAKKIASKSQPMSREAQALKAQNEKFKRSVAEAVDEPEVDSLRKRSRLSEAASPTIPVETPISRHNLRERPAPSPKITQTRARRKTQVDRDGSPKPTEEEISTKYNAMLDGLRRKYKQQAQPPRTSDLHEMFIHHVPVNELWRYYCLLPDDHATSKEVREATRVVLDVYRSGPVVPPPEAWIKELKHRLRLLLDAARDDGQSVTLAPRQWQLDIGMALTHVRDIAMESLYRGSYRSKRAKLGLLSEVLGLSGKGTYWKGGETFVGGGNS